MLKVLAQKTLPKTMAEFAQLQAPGQAFLKNTWFDRKKKVLWWRVSKVLWETKEPLKYMCALAELVITTTCSEEVHKPSDILLTPCDAESLTRGFGSLMDNMSKDKEFRSNIALTLGREMTVAKFLLSKDEYEKAIPHMNFHAVSIWLLGRFALASCETMPEVSAYFNQNTIVALCPTWTKYLESILQARLQMVYQQIS